MISLLQGMTHQRLLLLTRAARFGGAAAQSADHGSAGEVGSTVQSRSPGHRADRGRPRHPKERSVTRIRCVRSQPPIQVEYTGRYAQERMCAATSVGRDTRASSLSKMYSATRVATWSEASK